MGLGVEAVGRRLTNHVCSMAPVRIQGLWMIVVRVRRETLEPNLSDDMLSRGHLGAP